MYQVYPRLENNQTGILPAGSFLTASSDDTIRVWNLDPQMNETPGYKRNIYSSVSIGVQSYALEVFVTHIKNVSLCNDHVRPAGQFVRMWQKL